MCLRWFHHTERGESPGGRDLWWNRGQSNSRHDPKNRITMNSADQGGGLAYCRGIVEGNVINRNTAPQGALYDCDGTIQNNTISDNAAEEDGYALVSCNGIIRNCIIWGNGNDSQLSDSSMPMFSCIQSWSHGGNGNTSQYPYFVDAANEDYYLKSWFPCIDAGDPASSFSNEPEPNGGRVNMGVYGNTPEAASKSSDSDEDGLPDDWEIEFFEDLAESGDDDPDGDFIPNVQEYYEGLDPKARLVFWYVDVSVSPPGDGTSWENAFISIQDGIDAASDGHEVIVAEGTYLENIQFKGKNMLLRGTNPFKVAVVANTIIDGQGSGSVVTFAGTEEERCIISGFTIRNGEAERGGGICGTTEDKRTNATIQNNVISANSAGDGGGLWGCSGTIRNNIISANAASGNGGGLALCDGLITNNDIVANSAGTSGGGLCGCAGTITNSIIWGNMARKYSQLDSMITITPTNSCIEGLSDVTHRNISEDPLFVNAEKGNYHLQAGSPCIDTGTDDVVDLPPTDMDGERRPSGPQVDIGADEYIDTDQDDLADYWEIKHFGMLQLGPADDSDGDSLANLSEWQNNTHPGDPDTDDDGLHDGSEVLDAGTDPLREDTDGDGMPDGWEVEHHLDPLNGDASDDPDTDGLSNLQEYLNSTDPLDDDTDDDSKSDGEELFAGTNPLEPESLFRIADVSYTEAGTRLVWSVIPGKRYRVYFSTDLRNWSSVGKLRMASGDDTTLLFLDQVATDRAKCFYKVEVLP